jgi:hypothetical protein
MCRKIFFVLIVVFCSSCAVVYVPPARNVPLFVKRGEFNGTLSWGSSGTNIQTAYSVSNHLGVMGNFQVGGNRTHTSGDIGLGYYLRKRVAFEVYGGYGIGKGHGVDFDFGLDDEAIDLSGKYQRYFLQPSIGLYTKRTEWAFTLRVSALQFDELSLAIDRTSIQVPNERIYFVDPSFTMRHYTSANKRFYFQTQLGFSAYTETNNQATGKFLSADAEPVQFVVGIGVKLSGK